LIVPIRDKTTSSLGFYAAVISEKTALIIL